MITEIAHLCFVSSNLNASIAFYCDRLGLTSGFDDFNDEGERHGKYIHVGQRTFIELFKAELADHAPGQAYRYLCLKVDDLKATVVAVAVL